MSDLVPNEPNLPSFQDTDPEALLNKMLNTFSLPRNVVALPKEIQITWNNFQNILPDVHINYRNELLFRMMLAVRVGLFSSAINEVWNLTIIALKERIRKFGLQHAKHFLKKDIDEKYLREIKDHELLEICVKLGLLGEKDYFYLMHNKEIRNNYSSAHPTDSGMLDGTELTSFIHSCVKYVLSKEEESVGINIHNFISLLKSGPMPKDEIQPLSDKIKNSFEIQKNGILIALFGIFCDPTSDEFVRDNCLRVLQVTWETYNESAYSEILSIYSEYSIQDTQKRDLARKLFQLLGKIELLPKEEQYHIIHRAIKSLETAHHGFDNFFTEIPLAENLQLIYRNLPSSLYRDYVSTVGLCFIGNLYGTSRGASLIYREMVSNFNSKQIDILMDLYKSETLIRQRVRNTTRCRDKFIELVNLLPAHNITPQSKVEIDLVKKGTFK